MRALKILNQVVAVVSTVGVGHPASKKLKSFSELTQLNGYVFQQEEVPGILSFGPGKLGVVWNLLEIFSWQQYSLILSDRIT